MQLLLISLDPSVIRWTTDKLADFGFAPKYVETVAQAIGEGLAENSAAIILDLGKRSGLGAESVRAIRRSGIDQPLLVLSAGAEWRDRVAALDEGADDFIALPTRSEEIASRLRALIRRTAGNATDLVKSGDVELDLRGKCAWLAGECLDLTRNEFRLLRLFMLNSDRTMNHREIAEQLNPASVERSANAIEVQIARLRRKVGNRRIRTVRGVGYKYVALRDASAGFASHKGPCKVACGCGFSGELVGDAFDPADKSAWMPDI